MIFRTLVLKLHKFSNTMNLEGRGCTMDYFKRTLNELRESAGFNQAELADILEVSPKHYGYMNKIQLTYQTN